MDSSSVSEAELRTIRSVFPESASFKFISSWRPKKFLISKLLSSIDSVYADIESPGIREASFGDLMLRHFHDRLGLKSLVEFHVLDLVSNCVAQRTRCMEVDIFLRFLEGFYIVKDFEFFVALKRLVSCEPASLSLEECDRLCVKLFRNYPNSSELKRTVGDTIKEEISKKQNSRTGVSIQCDFFVYIALWVFHHQEVPPTTTRATSPNSSISDYVDSILMLKSQTHKQKMTAPKNILRESVQMEEVVNQMLADCCARETGNGGKEAVETADALMQAVMTGEEKNWNELGGNKWEFSDCLAARDNLLRAIEEGEGEAELEDTLFAFCGKIAQTRVLRDRSSYRT